MQPPLNPDDIYTMANALYDDDYMTEAITLYQSAMLKKQPTTKQLTLLREARRIEATQFISKLKQIYPQSYYILLEFAEYSNYSTQIYTELLNEIEDIELHEQLHFLRWNKAGRSKQINTDQVYSDIEYMARTREDTFDILLRGALQHSHLHTTHIPLLKKLIDADFIQDDLQSLIQAKISFLETIELINSSI